MLFSSHMHRHRDLLFYEVEFTTETLFNIYNIRNVSRWILFHFLCVSCASTEYVGSGGSIFKSFLINLDFRYALKVAHDKQKFFRPNNTLLYTLNLSDGEKKT